MKTLLRIETMESRMRHWAAGRLKRMPALIKYKTLKQLEFLKEVCDHLDRVGAKYCVAGGFAFDGRRGSLTRMHKDVDIAFVEEQRSVIVAALSEHGFRIRRWSPFITNADKGRLDVDLYEWKPCGNGRLECMMLDTVVRIPRAFLEDTWTVELMGVRYQIGSDALLISALPFVQGDSDRAFISSLLTAVPITVKTTTEVFTTTMEATVHEYAEMSNGSAVLACRPRTICES